MCSDLIFAKLSKSVILVFQNQNKEISSSIVSPPEPPPPAVAAGSAAVVANSDGVGPHAITTPAVATPKEEEARERKHSGPDKGHGPPPRTPPPAPPVMPLSGVKPPQPLPATPPTAPLNKGKLKYGLQGGQSGFDPQDF